MRARLIANPTSGSNRAATLLPSLVDRLRSIAPDLTVTLSESAADAAETAALAASDACDALFVAGGDGTLNTVLSGLVRNQHARLPAIGIIPLGTGNDFAKALAVGDTPESALECLIAQRVVDVDLGFANDRPFVNTSAGGFIARVTEVVTPALKGVAGKLAYVIGGARALIDHEPLPVRVLVDGQPATIDPHDVQLFAVANGRFIGGGHSIAPQALIDDGLLDVLVIPRKSMRSDTMRFRASALRLECDRPMHVNVDGELFDAQSCAYSVRPRALTFFCGAQPQAIAAPRMRR